MVAGTIETVFFRSAGMRDGPIVGTGSPAHFSDNWLNRAKIRPSLPPTPKVFSTT